MAQEVVVRGTLTAEMKDAGEELLQALDETNIPFEAALWLYIPELDIWRLLLGSSTAKQTGPKVLYERVQTILHDLPKDDPKLTIQNISIVELDNPFVSAIGDVFQIGPNISGVRLTQNTLNGIYLDDAYVYRLMKPKPPTRSIPASQAKQKGRVRAAS